MNRLIAFVRDEEAATAVEYAVMLALIILTALAAINSFGQQVGTMYGNVDTEMQAHGIN